MSMSIIKFLCTSEACYIHKVSSVHCHFLHTSMQWHIRRHSKLEFYHQAVCVNLVRCLKSERWNKVLRGATVQVQGHFRGRECHKSLQLMLKAIKNYWTKLTHSHTLTSCVSTLPSTLGPLRSLSSQIWIPGSDIMKQCNLLGAVTLFTPHFRLYNLMFEYEFHILCLWFEGISGVCLDETVNTKERQFFFF